MSHNNAEREKIELIQAKKAEEKSPPYQCYCLFAVEFNKPAFLSIQGDFFFCVFAEFNENLRDLSESETFSLMFIEVA